MLRSVSLLALVCLCLTLSAAEAPVEMTLDRTGVRTGETFTCTIVFSGEFSSPEFTVPSFKGLSVLSRNQSRNYQFRKGKAVIKNILRFTLVAYEPGTYTIEKAAIKDGDDEYSSEEIVVTVTGKALRKKGPAPEIEKGAVTL